MIAGPIRRNVLVCAVVLTAAVLDAALASGDDRLDPLVTECSFVLADPKAEENLFQAGMKLAMTMYWIVGLMNIQADKEGSKTFFGLSHVVCRAVRTPAQPNAML